MQFKQEILSQFIQYSLIFIELINLQTILIRNIIQ